MIVKNKKNLIFWGLVFVGLLFGVLTFFFSLKYNDKESFQIKINLIKEKKLEGYVNYCTKNSASCDQQMELKSCCLDHSLEMVHFLTKNLGPKIFLLDDQLLELVNQSGTKSWENNYFDMGMLNLDEESLLEMKPVLKEHGYILKNLKVDGKNDNPTYNYYSLSYSKKNDISLFIAIFNLCYVDNEFLLLNASQKYCEQIKTFTKDKRTKIPHIKTKHSIIHVIKTTLYDIDVYIPKNYIEYFNDSHGKDDVNKPKYELDKINGHNYKNRLKQTSIYPFQIASNIEQSSNDSYGLGPVLILNVDNRKERAHSMFLQLDKFDLYSERVPAITGKDLSKYKDFFIKKSNLLDGEKACFLTHLKAIQKSIDLNRPVLICEDDLLFPLNFNTVLRNIMTDISKLEDTKIIIRLGRFFLDANPSFQLEQNCKYIGFSSFATGTWAYIIFPEAARIFIDFIKKTPIKHPIDTIINPSIFKSKYQNKYINSQPRDLYKFYDIAYNDELDFNGFKLPYDKNRIEVVKELSTWASDSSSYTK
jgi:GR25 family glycosyltransferase involved in LPS biosynthesis